jgi:nitroimidazol reductase NimA-like FMN-containing flavoprotein (pyridoxamine 5'-phosphate oxidase superfamily)
MQSELPSRLSAQEWEKARELLIAAPFAFLALVDSGRPYAIPLNFAYLPGDTPARDAADSLGRLVFHTGPGRKTAALDADARVCVVATAGETFVKGSAPCKDGFGFRSVLVEGRAAVVTEDAERDLSLRAIVAKHDPEGATRPFDPAVLARTLVYAVDIETVSYRELG